MMAWIFSLCDAVNFLQAHRHVAIARAVCSTSAGHFRVDLRARGCDGCVLCASFTWAMDNYQPTESRPFLCFLCTAFLLLTTRCAFATALLDLRTLFISASGQGQTGGSKRHVRELR